jgi:PIN domain nuclease of toxin-antitoxin system
VAKTDVPAGGLLLDTHVFLWWRENSRRLKPVARRAIEVADVVFVSAATAWEASIKAALGRLEIPDTIEAGVADSGFEELPIRFPHADLAARLPRHHDDPFDRMLVAQATLERLTLVTHDQRIRPYDVAVLWT